MSVYESNLILKAMTSFFSCFISFLSSKLDYLRVLLSF